MFLNIVVFILICAIVYFIYGTATDKEAERREKQNPLNRASLEAYTIKKNLFLQFKKYLYNNIDHFKRVNDKTIIRNKIELDFPNYGEGIDGEGIMFDLSNNDLFKIDYKGKVKLGKTFQTISIAYSNFKIFAGEIYNSNYQMGYSQGGYSSDFGDKITSRVFYLKLGRAKMYVGLSSGDREISKFAGKHNFESEADEMYLFTELEINVNNSMSYPHFNIINLRKDMSLEDYHSFFKKNLEICNNKIQIN